MALYRANPADGAAWVTGASSGIGRRLALDLASKGYTVVASARGGDELEKLAAEAAALGARIVPIPLDITDEAACALAVSLIEREVGPLALAVLNAGTYRVTRGERLDTADFQQTFGLNVLGTSHCLVPVIKAMQARRQGQVALVGSLTSYVALPGAATYGASKAALNFIAQSLKFDLEKMNIRIQVINPGFVETPLTARNDFSMPALMKVEDASDRIVAGLERGGFEIAFPRRLAYALAVLRLLPEPLRHAAVRQFTGWGKRPLRP